MKNAGDTQTTIIRGDGPLEGMTCVTDFGFKVRAYPMESVVPTEYHKPGKINVGAAVGKGSLTVIRDILILEPQFRGREFQKEFTASFLCGKSVSVLPLKLAPFKEK